MRWPHALRSLRHRNFRLFATGQTVSLLGSWMQTVAMGWLVYRLTGSARMLGLIAFLTQVPAFILGPWAGSLADRFPRRGMLLFTQGLALFQAAILALLTFTGWVQAWQLIPLAVLLGISHALEIPARHSLIAELAGEDTSNAVAFNSAMVNTARVLGPTLGGAIIAWVGEAWCFGINAISFVAVLIALMRIELSPRAEEPESGGVLEGFRYAARTPVIRAPLLLLAASSLLVLPYQSLMPLVSAELLGGDAATYGRMLTCVGVGALGGAVTLMHRESLRGLARWLGLGAIALALGILGVGFSHSVWLTGTLLVITGFGFITQTAGTLTLLQSVTPDALRGRVLGLFSMLFIGAAPFGALAMGWATAHFGVTATLATGAVLALIASIAYHLTLPAVSDAPVQTPEPEPEPARAA